MSADKRPGNTVEIDENDLFEPDIAELKMQKI